MIPVQSVYETYWFDSDDRDRTNFDLNCLVETASQIVVDFVDTDGIVTTLEQDVDYTVSNLNNENGCYIVYPKEGSSHSILSEGEALVLKLTLPVEQMIEYSKSATFSFNQLEYSLDYLTRLIQILYAELAQTAKMPEGSDQTMQEFINEMMSANSKAKQWAEKTDGAVEGTAYSAKYHAQQAGNSATIAQQSANIAEQYAENARFGVKWVTFSSANWELVSGEYKMVIYDSMIVLAVYKGTWNDKELVSGVNVKKTDTATELTSKNSFGGFMLVATSILGYYCCDDYENVGSDEWIIDHNFGRIPQIILVDNNGTEFEGTKSHPTLNRSVVTFENAVTGKAYCL